MLFKHSMVRYTQLVPVVFSIARKLGCTNKGATLAASFVIFDMLNATESRLVLMDAQVRESCPAVFSYIFYISFVLVSLDESAESSDEEGGGVEPPRLVCASSRWWWWSSSCVGS